MFFILFLTLIWGGFLKIAYERDINHNLFINPIFLFFLPQLIVLWLYVFLDKSGIVVPVSDFNLYTFLYILLLSSSFFFGYYINNTKHEKNRIKLIKNNKSNNEKLFTFFFVFCTLIGTYGTYKLLSNIGISYNLLNVNNIFQENFSRFNEEFFNSSHAILWQANIAALFWFSFSRKSYLTRFLVFIVIINILFRGAYVYLIIAFFYFMAPVILREGLRKSFIIYAMFFVFVINLVAYLSYDWTQGNPVDLYFQKIYPYTSGNYVNLSLNIITELEQYISGTIPWNDLLSNLGFGSVFSYLDKYLSFNLSAEESYLIFHKLSSNLPIYGNTSTFYGNLVYVPIPLTILHVFILGYLSRFFYVKSNVSLIALSVLAWFSAAHFLSFATGGHFSTTRFIPALLYIWPLIFIFTLLKKTRK